MEPTGKGKGGGVFDSSLSGKDGSVDDFDSDRAKIGTAFFLNAKRV